MPFLRPDSEFMNAVSTCADYVILNVLCLIFCLPVVTAGAAMTAKYYVSMKMVRGEEPAVTKSFFHAFRQNFRQSLAVWGILGGILCLLALDWYLIVNAETGTMNPVFSVLLAVLTLLVLGTAFCAFPLLARFQMSTKEVIRGGAVFTMMKLPRVILALVICALTYFVGFWYMEWFLAIWIFSTAVMLYYNSRMFVKEFQKLEEQNGIESVRNDAEDDRWSLPEEPRSGDGEFPEESGKAGADVCGENGQAG